MAEWDESNSVGSTFKYKIPFFVFGVAVGMLIVWVAFQWVPATLVAATALMGG